MRLVHVGFWCFDGVGKILCCVGCGKSRPHGKVASVDGLQPGGLDRKTGFRVVEADKGLNDGKIIGSEGCGGGDLCIGRCRWCVSGHGKQLEAPQVWAYLIAATS